MDDAGIAYDERGLVPCVIQDWDSGEVLTLAWTNAEALARTRATGELHLWSRSPVARVRASASAFVQARVSTSPESQSWITQGTRPRSS